MIKVLLIEDDAPLRNIIKGDLEDFGASVEEAGDLKTAVRKIQQDEFDVVVMDLILPDGSSIVLLEKYPAQTVARTIIITANPTIPGVVEAIKKGAYNYLEKPIDPEVLQAQVEKIVEINRLRFEQSSMAEEMVSAFSFDTIVHRSKAMKDVVDRARILAGTTNSILIQGETGVGKEVMAHALHNESDRKNNVFLPVNCAAIPAELFESELFGFEKGAFTGATSCYSGRFLQADGGTLFLDEIGELPMPIQAKLLRVLDERLIYRLRSVEPLPVNVRLIVATNRDLLQEVKAKQFRSDLYYRLKESSIIIPPLRDREEDIMYLFHYFMKIYSRFFKKDVRHINREAEKYLINHTWEGNVRELKNTVKNIIPFKNSDTIDMEDLSPIIMDRVEPQQKKLMSLEQMEDNYILKILKVTGFNISRSADILKISRSRIYRKLEQFDLDDIS